MLEQIITTLSSQGIFSSVSNNMDVLTGIFDQYLTGANNLRLASIILMLLAFVLFLFLIIILYVKSIIAFLKSDGSSSKRKSVLDELREEEERQNLNDELELEKELEKELERELEKAQAEKVMKEQMERDLLLKQQQETEERKVTQEKNEKEEKAKEKQKEENTAEKQKEEIGRRDGYTQANILDLDWKIGRAIAPNTPPPAVNIENLQYQQTHKQLTELLGLIIDMVGRGVDDLKIAQTVMFRNQGKNSEDDIMQTIDALKDFIALCVNGKFEHLQNSRQMPEAAEALYHLAQGDNSLALAMLENLMDSNIENSASMTSGPRRDQIFAETSNYACTFGTIAALSDIHLATSSYELSIELSPSNVNAWSRVADMYYYADSKNKAVWAYENVLKMADEDIYPRQVANANKMLSQYYYERGNSLQAAKLFNSSKQYYDSLGINRRLDKQEVEIIEIIEANQSQDLQNTIAQLLSNNSIRQYSFG